LQAMKRGFIFVFLLRHTLIMPRTSGCGSN
jgi:hypothetical protein